MPDAPKPLSVCVVAEDLSLPIDEGIKHFAVSLLRQWSREHPVLGISARSRRPPATPHTVAPGANRFFLSSKLSTALKQFKPDVVCYVPSASATLFSFLRARALKLYCPSAMVIMISLQPRRYGRLSRFLIRRLAPDLLFVQHEASLRQLADMNLKVKMLAGGVDLEKFTPVSRDKKAALRTGYALDPGAFTVLHVGHITEGRNIDLLADINQRHGAQVVLVGSSIVHPDRAAVTARLKRQGVIVIDRYVENIEEFYQLSDCYLFPVVSERDCIGTPLSVLEAMACNLPVLTLRYGMLPRLFEEGGGLFFADGPEGLVEKITDVKHTNGCHTRDKAAACSWGRVAADILEQAVKLEESRS